MIFTITHITPTLTMRTLIIVCSVFLLGTSLTKAQSGRTRLGFVPYSDPSVSEQQYRQMAYDYLYETVTRIFINTQRFDILDRSKFDIVKLEKNITKGEDFINSEIVKQGNALAAEVLAIAKITALSLKQAEDNQGWSAFLTVELKQIDVETAKAVSALQLKGAINDGVGDFAGVELSKIIRVPSPEQAISRIVLGMEKDLRNWIDKQFPVKMQVVHVDPIGQFVVGRGGKNIGLTTRDNMCLRHVYRLPSGDQLEETIVELSFIKEDGIGQTSTKFKPQKSKEWDLVVEAIKQYGEKEVFIMECPGGKGPINNIFQNN